MRCTSDRSGAAVCLGLVVVVAGGMGGESTQRKGAFKRSCTKNPWTSTSA